jgi:hypothetical protein
VFVGETENLPDTVTRINEEMTGSSRLEGILASYWIVLGSNVSIFNVVQICWVDIGL